MARDPLVVLARVQALTIDARRRALAEARAAEEAARATVRAREAGLGVEAARASGGTDPHAAAVYAVWHRAHAAPAIMAARAHAADAEAGVAAMRDALAQARLDARATERLIEERAARARRAWRRREARA